jgi:hypothetical protein
MIDGQAGSICKVATGTPQSDLVLIPGVAVKQGLNLQFVHPPAKWATKDSGPEKVEYRQSLFRGFRQSF